MDTRSSSESSRSSRTPPSQRPKAKRVVRSKLRVKESDAVDYDIDPQYVIQQHPNFIAVSFSGVYNVARKDVTLNDGPPLPIRPLDPKSKWLSDLISRSKTRKGKRIFFHCPHCQLGFHTKGNVVRHANGIPGDRNRPRCDMFTEHKIPVRCDGLSLCIFCSEPTTTPAAGIQQMDQQEAEDERELAKERQAQPPPRRAAKKSTGGSMPAMRAAKKTTGGSLSAMRAQQGPRLDLPLPPEDDQPDSPSAAPEADEQPSTSREGQPDPAVAHSMSLVNRTHTNQHLKASPTIQAKVKKRLQQTKRLQDSLREIQARKASK